MHLLQYVKNLTYHNQNLIITIVIINKYLSLLIIVNIYAIVFTKLPNKLSASLLFGYNKIKLP